jgi:hypothetical protein
MDDLRDVAHGIYPAVLGDEGLAAAVDALAEASPFPVVVVDMVEERFDAAIEVAAYHVIADVVRAATALLRIRARRADDVLTIELTGCELADPAEEDISDRVGAVDGTIELVRDHEASTTTMVAKIPCRPAAHRVPLAIGVRPAEAS